MDERHPTPDAPPAPPVEKKKLAAPSLTRPQREDILRRYEAGELVPDIARDLGYTESAIYKTLERLTKPPENKGRDQSYLENCRWAIAAAGEFLRTRQRPTTCPNNAAWFLYCQAVENPKEFLTKIGQVEAKADTGESERAVRAEAKRSVAEIEQMLETLGARD